MNKLIEDSPRNTVLLVTLNFLLCYYVFSQLF